MATSNAKKPKIKKKKKFTFFKFIKILLLLIIMSLVIGGIIVGGAVLSIIKEVPAIDPSNINASLQQTSRIYDDKGELLEKIQTEQFRTIVTIDKMPQYLLDAFISIEDERFMEHNGVDPVGIVAATIDNFKSGDIVRGASTLTQQLARNLYLNNDKTMSRKIKEAYLALQIEKALSKEQVLEAYLNRINLGQGAYGVQEAAQTYFSKNVEELTIAESALFAGIVKSPTNYPPYLRVRPENFNPDTDIRVGEVDVLGETLIAIYNPKCVERQKVVLSKMHELGKITDQQYQEALAQDISASIKPGQKVMHDMTSFFVDYVKTQATYALADHYDFTYEQAQDVLFTGGLQIFSTVDVNMQKQLEGIYNDFTNIVYGDSSYASGPILINISKDGNGNIVNRMGEVIYYNKANLFNDSYDLVLPPGDFTLDDSGLSIHSNVVVPYPKHMDIEDVYSINEKNNLVAHIVGSITIPPEHYSVEGGRAKISKEYLDNAPQFYSVTDGGNLIISHEFFSFNKKGIVQPQSATVIIDYHTGEIKALMGGRDVDGNRILNRATDSKRQPGSSMKPLASYLPALDNGMTAGTAIMDEPIKVINGKQWPRNWYGGYWGPTPLRRAVEQSSNAAAVKALEITGIDTSMKYLERMGIIDPEHPDRDSFVTAKENPVTNDENLSLALGGMTEGISPLDITAAYGSIANDGVFIKPRAFTKILDKNGNLLIDNTPKETRVVSSQISYIMKDILRTTVSNGIAGAAAMNGFVTAGKTGTTDKNADIWFVGFTPYYVAGTWIGNDSPQITLTKGSGTATKLWRHIMTSVHEGLEHKTSFVRPDGIIEASLCSISGKRPSDLCSSDVTGGIIHEIFAGENIPDGICDAHYSVTVCGESGLLPNEFCPSDQIQTRVYPKSGSTSAPTEHCNIHDEHTMNVTPVDEDTEVNVDNILDQLIPPEEDEEDDDEYGNNRNNGEDHNNQTDQN
ncbi:MAG: transglycosylase [Tissierellia bacterium]|nr:transglycosylase [Tissierellia bacterium]